MNNKHAKAVWNEMGAWWDEALGDGDIFHKNLLYENLDNLLDLKNCNRLLDLACGNGAYTRRLAMAHPNIEIVGCDFSTSLLNCAKERAKASDVNIKYLPVDLMDRNDLQNLQKTYRAFDRILSSMAIHDIEDLTLMSQFIPQLLTDDGFFVVSTVHPCFNSGSLQVLVEENDNHFGVLRSTYIKSESILLKSKPKQPINQPTFHRSLSTLINTFTQNGLVLTQLVEPSFSQVDTANYGGCLWERLPEITPAIILKFAKG